LEPPKKIKDRQKGILDLSKKILISIRKATLHEISGVRKERL